MNREILFRGKRLDNGKWVFGYYVRHAETDYIYTGKVVEGNHLNEYGLPCADAERYAVDPATVGQYTGMKDRNKKRLFEGDIIRFKTWKDGTLCWVGVISFDYCSFIVKGGPHKESDCPFELQMSGVNGEWCERIGNIHDNPELLKHVGGEYGPK